MSADSTMAPSSIVAGAATSHLLNTCRRGTRVSVCSCASMASCARWYSGDRVSRQVMQYQHRIGAADLGPAALNADALDLIERVIGRTQARGIDHVHRHAVDLNRLRDLVARGARDRRHDRQLGAGQRVEQRALAHVGLAGEHHVDALAQQRAAPRRAEHRVQPFVDAAPGGRWRRHAAGSRSPRRENRASPRPASAARPAPRPARSPRARTRPPASGRPTARPLRCRRRSGRPPPRPAPGRACR